MRRQRPHPGSLGQAGTAASTGGTAAGSWCRRSPLPGKRHLQPSLSILLLLAIGECSGLRQPSMLLSGACPGRTQLTKACAHLHLLFLSAAPTGLCAADNSRPASDNNIPGRQGRSLLANYFFEVRCLRKARGLLTCLHGVHSTVPPLCPPPCMHAIWRRLCFAFGVANPPPQAAHSAP